MTDERPLWNEIACPKDFNSAVTDKSQAPIYADTRSRDREDSPRVRAGGLPFSAAHAGLQGHNPPLLLSACLHQVSPPFWYSPLGRRQPEKTMGLLTVCNVFHIH